MRLHTNRGQDEGGRQIVSTDRPAPSVTTKAYGQWKQETEKPEPIVVELHELAAIQDFPDGFPFVGGKTSVARQIGNAVPSSLAEVIVRALTEDKP